MFSKNFFFLYCWFQLLKWQDLLLFFAIYESKFKKLDIRIIIRWCHIELLEIGIRRSIFIFFYIILNKQWTVAQWLALPHSDLLWLISLFFSPLSSLFSSIFVWFAIVQMFSLHQCSVEEPNMLPKLIYKPVKKSHSRNLALNNIWWKSLPHQVWSSWRLVCGCGLSSVWCPTGCEGSRCGEASSTQRLENHCCHSPPQCRNSE